jgi:intron-binding protein aquarius
VQIPTANYSGGRPLALPKLNLQFLSPSDYLLRNFHLFRLEAAYEVREDIEVRVKHAFADMLIINGDVGENK